MTGREKWKKFLAGEDVGTMVCPLCDKWGTDFPYKWNLPFPEPFHKGEYNFMLSQQLVMSEHFGWDSLFYASIEFRLLDETVQPKVMQEEIGENRVRITTTIDTPYGELVQVEEENEKTRMLVKDFLQDDEDFRKMIWYVEKQMDFDEADALEQGKKFREAVGDRGMLGFWFGTAAILADIQVLFYHLSDYPDEFEALWNARKKLFQKQLAVYRKAGFDFIFYIIPGTEWVSPEFFREWMYDEIKENISQWREWGGFTLWHTCGHEKAFMERGFYNELLPDIFETLSEPPVGNLPSIKWARERLDPRIISKGNISLDIMLNGTEEQVREQVHYVLDNTKGYRHIVGLSDNILDDTPERNLKALVDECRKS